MFKAVYEKKNEIREILNYLILAIITSIVSILIYDGLIKFKIVRNFNLANFISIMFAIIFAYFVNKKFVFETNLNKKETFKEFFNFMLASLFSLAIEVAVFYVALDIMGLNDQFVKISNQCLIIILDYIIDKQLVFNDGKLKTKKKNRKIKFKGKYK